MADPRATSGSPEPPGEPGSTRPPGDPGSMSFQEDQPREPGNTQPPQDEPPQDQPGGTGGRVDPHEHRGELHTALFDLARAVEFPPTPDISARVRERIARERAPATRRWLPSVAWPRSAPVRRSALLAGLAILVLAGVVVAAAVGIPGIRIIFLPGSDAPDAPSPVPTVATPARPTPDPLGVGLALGERVTLEEALERISFPALVPTSPGLSSPDAVYVSRSSAGGRLSLVYRARPGLPEARTTGVGLLITEFDGRINREGMEKLVDEGTTVEEVEVDGADGYWLEGATHVFVDLGTGREFEDDRVRLAGNVLMWDADGVSLRLEADVSRDVALTIARSMARP